MTIVPVIKLDSYTISKCSEFAISRIRDSYNLYRFRGKSKYDKILSDIKTGAMGEWGVYYKLLSCGYDASEPDMDIYSDKCKSYNCDLELGDVRIHVKSQSLDSCSRYGNSWLVQKSDPMVLDPHYLDLFAFTSVDPINGTVNVLGFHWADSMKYSECAVPSYRKTKLSVYLRNIRGTLIQL